MGPRNPNAAVHSVKLTFSPMKIPTFPGFHTIKMVDFHRRTVSLQEGIPVLWTFLQHGETFCLGSFVGGQGGCPSPTNSLSLTMIWFCLLFFQ